MHRCKVVAYHGNNLATFECPNGHTWKETLVPKDPRGKIPSELMLKKMAGWWKKQGVAMTCRKCARSGK